MYEIVTRQKMRSHSLGKKLLLQFQTKKVMNVICKTSLIKARNFFQSFSWTSQKMEKKAVAAQKSKQKSIKRTQKILNKNCSLENVFQLKFFFGGQSSHLASQELADVVAREARPVKNEIESKNQSINLVRLSQVSKGIKRSSLVNKQSLNQNL